jgi:D-arabinitol dehydrogenase (NADP+)
LNGWSYITIASNAGLKIDLARSYNFVDEVVAVDRVKPEEQWSMLRAAHPRGFDVVVEATSVLNMLPMAIDLCARGGTVVFYGACEPSARILVQPSRIILDEITLLK